MIRLVGFERVVSDLTRSERFYGAHLGFSCRERTAGSSTLVRGSQVLTLQTGSTPPPETTSETAFQHLALPVAEIGTAVGALPAGTPAFSRAGPQHLPARSGGVTAWKFRDPDGHPLELIEFPDHRTGGIDHSAMVVADAASSIEFYERLGLRLMARQINRGVEQDRLDGLDGAVVEVIALSADGETPHLELLAYRSPTVRVTGRSGTRLVFAVSGGGESDLVDPDGHELKLIKA